MAEPCEFRYDATGMKRRVLVRDLNPHITCSLCEGYLIDATAINECLHTFCRSCIVRYLESSKYCPTCDILVHKNKPLSALKPDRIVQLLVYKLIPSVYQNEVKRRAEFYTNARASSSCSEDSILTDSHTETPEESIFSHIQSSISDFFSPDDSISLSLEYYNEEIDPAMRKSDIDMILDDQDVKFEQNNNNDEDGGTKPIETRTTQDKNENIVHKRYLQCPAGVNIKHLSKFIRMKYGLSFHHRVDIIYEEEVLPKYFTLMDVAYSFKYKRSDPMRFMYRIFESPPPSRRPQPVQQQTPLTPSPDSSPKSSTEHRDPCDEKPEPNTGPEPDLSDTKPDPDRKQTTDDEKQEKEEVVTTVEQQNDDEFDEDDIQEFAKKRDLEWANLIRQQQEESDKIDEKEEESCEEFETIELSKLRSGGGLRRVEVRRSSSGNESKKHDGSRKKSFHEKESFYRKNSEEEDRSSRRYSSDSNEKPKKGSGRHYGDSEKIPKHVYKKSTSYGEKKDEYFRRSESKKRKKSKHSRHADVPKRRRLHAEIQNQFEKEDILKLKVKLTPPSVQKVHKHRHSDENVSNTTGNNELSAKERLLQMRQVRHKNIQNNQQELKVVIANNEQKSVVETSVENQEQESVVKTNPDSSKKVRFEIETNEQEPKPVPSKQEPIKLDPPTPPPKKDLVVVPPTPQQKPTPEPPPAVPQPSSPQRKCVLNLIAPNSFTVSKIISGEKRKSESQDQFPDPKIPSLEITLINPTSQKQFPSSNLVPNKNYQPSSPGFTKQNVAKNVNPVKPTPKPSNPIQKNLTGPSTSVQLKSVPSKPEQIKQVQRLLNPTGIGTNGPTAGGSILNRTQQQVQKTGLGQVSQSKPGSGTTTITKPLTQIVKKTGNGVTGKPNAGTTSKPPPATIPLSKIKKIAAGLVQDPKKTSQRVDNFGALDLSEKSSRLTTSPDETKNDLEIGKDGKKESTASTKAQNFSNLHILSESAVRIRDLMVSAQNKNMSGLFGSKLLAKLEMHKNKLAAAQKEIDNEMNSSSSSAQQNQSVPKIENKPIVVLSPKIQMQQMVKKDMTVTRIEPGVNKTEPTKELVPKVSVSPINPTSSVASKIVPNPRVPSPKSSLGTTQSKSSKGVESTSSPSIAPVPVTKSNVPALVQQATKCVQQLNSGPKPVSGTPKPSLSGCPPIPNLQMLKIPVLQNSKSLEAQMKSLQKMPKLQEISKMGHFGNVAQIRGTPNQAVRNIPNPSALMARQHQILNRDKPSSASGTGGSGATSNGTGKEVKGSNVATCKDDETTKNGPETGPVVVVASSTTTTTSATVGETKKES